MLKHLIYSILFLVAFTTCGPKFVIGTVSDVQFSERDKLYKITALTVQNFIPIY